MNPNRQGSFVPRALASLLIVALSFSGSVGCTIFRDPVPPVFERISLQAQAERNKEGRLEGDLVAYSTLKGVLVGTAIGGPSLAITAGGATFGLSLYFCLFTVASGPFAFFFYPACVVTATLIALVAGFAVGAVGGGVIGGVTGLPSDTAKQVTEALSHLEEGRNFEAEMLTALQEAVPAQKQVAAAGAEGVVTARLKELELNQHTKNRLSLRLSASMVQAWQAEGKKKKNTCKYRYDSERKEANTWLADGGAAFGQAVTQGIETVARWMNRDLDAFATKKELAKTETDPRSCYRAPHWYDIFLLW